MRDHEILDYIEQFYEGRPTPEAVAWMQKGMCQLIDEGVPLEQGLSLNRVHPRGAREAVNLRKMRRHLHRAAGLLPETTAWARAKLLVREIQKFRAYRWPKLREYTEAPDCLTPLDREIFGAFKARPGKVPESPNRLSEILSER
ncbi:hypothetical protein SAMN02949497_3243 [Methylomagnum ishizawai]|uniref:Uncharacterized protein n=1 Tax=Methylomagnum ishizawai TaxID=1760988 RepID=A0A1Y6CZQ6_9GAMM|nr:hypothetical protein [Methylomagnum ishizawai]SMF95867.1 hypothetical protein SAMN02949497_3243 [Methylomagnum ishizawai]